MSDAIGRFFFGGALVFVGGLFVLTAFAKYPEAFVATAVGIGMMVIGFRVARPHRPAGRRPRP
jgi:uncharacterized membrane protein YccC